MTAAPRLLSVNVAMAQPLRIGSREVLSGIHKRGVAGDVEVRPLGLAGDEQADPSLHGGLDKAVYAYPSEHYRVWQTVRAQAGLATWDAELPAGFFGENLTLEGLLENQVWIGDVLKFAHCELAVAGPRQPCFKFNAVMGLGQASKLMVQSGYCGFYLAVRTPGTIAAGEAFELAPGPREVGIPELFRSVRAKHR
ncbi:MULTISPECIES: MOSC domain-containing protein [Burkholderiales]|uniref:MOSC domain-containing protein n=1 Tax=Burkholderiales TaxID=80840 RepID=UPI0017CDA24E|nr:MULTISPECIES: MOSC domain-containing protein [Burkholderiales]MBA2673958.1 MOSC domain-containing protein [Ramlibacter sp.]MBA3595845.1 MOSC domain-containing protein [Methylibium sp.]